MAGYDSSHSCGQRESVVICPGLRGTVGLPRKV